MRRVTAGTWHTPLMMRVIWKLISAIFVLFGITDHTATHVS